MKVNNYIISPGKRFDSSTTFIPKRGRYVAIAAGDYHSLFIDSKNAIYAMGSNSHGQCGMGKQSDAKTGRY